VVEDYYLLVYEAMSLR